LFQLKTTVPTGKRSLPGIASTTSWNPEPVALWKIAAPSVVVPTGEITVPSAAARANAAISGPTRGVGVGVGGVNSSCATARMSAALATPSPLASITEQPPAGPEASSPNRCSVTAASCASGYTHCVSASSGVGAMLLKLHKMARPMKQVRTRVKYPIRCG
jgi:hypothetical protein